MTIQEKREALDRFCDGVGPCSGCPLKGRVCRCGRGVSFLSKENGVYEMTDEEIEAAYDIAFPRKATEPYLAPTIKDSGDRTKFSTGAVRDMHTGKGRMDLLPWRGIISVSQLCEEGALKYGERNVDKGIPLHSLLDSAARHLAKHIAGETDEDHLRAAAWNLLWALEQRVTHPELDDMPKYV